MLTKHYFSCWSPNITLRGKGQYMCPNCLYWWKKGSLFPSYFTLCIQWNWSFLTDTYRSKETLRIEIAMEINLGMCLMRPASQQHDSCQVCSYIETKRCTKLPFLRGVQPQEKTRRLWSTCEGKVSVATCKCSANTEPALWAGRVCSSSLKEGQSCFQICASL